VTINLSPIIGACTDFDDPLTRDGGCEAWVPPEEGGTGMHILWLPCQAAMPYDFFAPDVAKDDVFHVVKEFARGCDTDPTSITATRMDTTVCLMDQNLTSIMETCHIDATYSIAQWSNSSSCGFETGTWPDSEQHFTDNCSENNGVVHSCATAVSKGRRWTKLYEEEMCSTSPVAWVVQNRWGRCFADGSCLTSGVWSRPVPEKQRRSRLPKRSQAQPLEWVGNGQDVGMLEQMHSKETLEPSLRRRAAGHKASLKNARTNGGKPGGQSGVLKQDFDCWDNWGPEVLSQDLLSTHVDTTYMVMRVFSSKDCNGTFWYNGPADAVAMHVGVKLSDECINIVNQPLLRVLDLNSVLPPLAFSTNNSMTRLSCVNVDSHTGVGQLEYTLGCDGPHMLMDPNVCWKPWGQGVQGVSFVPGVGGVKLACLVKVPYHDSPVTWEPTVTTEVFTTTESVEPVVTTEVFTTESVEPTATTSAEVTTTSEASCEPTLVEVLPRSFVNISEFPGPTPVNAAVKHGLWLSLLALFL